MNPSLLVELLTEELPPKALRQMGERFAQSLTDSLARAGLMKPGGAAGVRVFATPRRLAALLGDVRVRADDRVEEKKLMPAKVAFAADGSASAALTKRLEKESASFDQVERRMDGGTEYAFLKQLIPGVALAAGLHWGGLQGAGWAVSAAMAGYFGYYFWALATWPVMGEAEDNRAP